jgi:amino acid transporter
VAAVRLRRSQPDRERGYRAPALTLICVVGFAASAAALLIGFVPPTQTGGSPLTYIAIVGSGALGLGLLIPYLLLRFRKPSWKEATAEGATGPDGQAGDAGNTTEEGRDDH